MGSTGSEAPDGILICILNRETRVCGYTWIIEAHDKSFYIKPTYKPMQMAKVSIHNPDEEHETEYYRLDFARTKISRKAIRAGGGWGAFGKTLPLEFTGRPVNKRTVHLARFSAEWSMFRRGMQRGPNPVPSEKAQNAAVDAPGLGKVTHVDLYMSRVRPYWLNKEDRVLREKNAGLGPLHNAADRYLTAVISQVSIGKEPDPFGDPSKGVPAEDCIRGIAEGVDNTGLLWISEKMIPKSKLEQADTPERD